MKTDLVKGKGVYKLPVIITVFCIVCTIAGAQFSSGSDGSDGAFYVPSTSGTITLDLPADGIFNYTIVTIEEGATVKYKPNSLNTPVYILAKGDILLNGIIDVSGISGTQSPPMGGLGGPGGFDGGAPGILGSPPGDGHGPGGGRAGTNDDPWKTESAGAGSYGGRPLENQSDLSDKDGPIYGSPLLVPLAGGSGGAGTEGQPGRGGGGGGGAVLLASDTQVVINSTGVIKSVGGNNSASPKSPAQGSGGAVRIVAPKVSGDGTIDVNGGYTNEYYGCRGGHGRIRVDTIDRTELNISMEPVSAASVGSYMAVFPTPMPRLDIIHAAGEDIPEGTGSAVQVILPFDDPTDQTITVQARNFKGTVPIRIRVHPENGSYTDYDTEIDMAGGATAQVSQVVTLPKNTLTNIYVWTR